MLPPRHRPRNADDAIDRETESPSQIFLANDDDDDDDDDDVDDDDDDVDDVFSNILNLLIK